MLINIRQAHRKEAYPAFFLYHNDLALMMEQFYKSYEQFLKIINSSAPVVIHQFLLNPCLSLIVRWQGNWIRREAGAT